MGIMWQNKKAQKYKHSCEREFGHTKSHPHQRYTKTQCEGAFVMFVDKRKYVFFLLLPFVLVANLIFVGI